MRVVRRWIAVCMILAVLAGTFGSWEGQANEEKGSELVARSEDSARMSRRLGFGVGVADPYPGILGLNAAFNVIDMVRVDVGYAEVSVLGASATTLGIGGKAFVPGWNLSPIAGLHFAHVSYSGDGLTVNGFNESGGHVYGSIGIDYQSSIGFNGGIGYHFSFRSEIPASAYVQLGWFFDLI